MANKVVKRLISSVFIFFIFFISIFYIKNLFKLIAIIIHLLMLYEWYAMVRKRIFCKEFWIGFVSISCSLISVIYLFTYDPEGKIIFNFIFLIWGVDVIAMVSGKILSNTKKLAIVISPNKTWAGFIIGACSSAFSIWMLSYFFNLNINHFFFISEKYLMIFAIILGMLAQISDLFVSYFKRKFSIKDTGKIIPGHGGVLDRFDSILLTAPTVSIILVILEYFNGHNISF
ncbi:MAG: phosphatidate cytidylyltransferase [Rickettsia sp.]|nr:phosphatidate cytidylyltransferase [Rickettsia sp.]